MWHGHRAAQRTAKSEVGEGEIRWKKLLKIQGVEPVELIDGPSDGPPLCL